MMHAVLFDCEFLAIEGSQRRFWSGPYDPDPVPVQIGAVKFALDGDFPILDQLNLLIRPPLRPGSAARIDPFLTDLTGIRQQDVDEHGCDLKAALQELDRFSEGARLWSWGKDELNLIAIGCYVAGIAAPLPVERFGNACTLFLAAGMAYADMQRVRSGALAQYYGQEAGALRAHDALDDSLSLYLAARHLLQEGALKPGWFAEPDAIPIQPAL